MKRTTAVVTVISILLAAILIHSDFTSKNPLTKVREKVIISEETKFPALVRLTDVNGRTICSGSVIAENLVLTAAHCLGDEVIVESLPNSKGEVTFVRTELVAGNRRADYALISGDFRGFTVFQTETDPEKDLLYNQTELVSCGFPWGAGPVCYPILTPLKKMIEGFQAEGQMYPAMSGGPVIDVETGKVVGVNHGIGDNSVMFMPLIGLFEMLRGR